MKSMLIAALVIGAAIATLIVYSEEQRKPVNRVGDAAEDAYDTMNKAIGSVERPVANSLS